MNPNSRILFLGGGNMSRAIVAGLVKKHKPDNIFVVDKHAEKLSSLEKEYAVNTSQNLSDFTFFSDIIFLSIKPQGAKEACEILKPLIARRNPLIISIMAGVTIEKIKSYLNHNLSIIRAMPNTPALIQKAAIGMYAPFNISIGHKQSAEYLFSSIGITAWVAREEQLNIITALSGSGPAYYFYFIELMKNIAVKMGLDAKTANDFAIQTAYGAAELAFKSEDDVVILRQQVTSKKGTTLAAIECMNENHLDNLLEKAMTACIKRAEELSKEN